LLRTIRPLVGLLALFICLIPSLANAQPATSSSNSAAPGMLDIIFSGGPIGVAIITLLVALSLTSAYLVFDQIMNLRRSEIMPDGLSEKVLVKLQDGQIAESLKVCQAEPSLLAYVLSEAIAEIDGGWTAVEKSLEDAVAEQSARLMRKIEYLSVIGNIAPMVGLLGTVIGMIFAFQQVATTQGAAGAAQLAEGIYQALVTTVGGLIVAIPSLGAFAIFRNRVDQLVAEAASEALHVFTPLKRRRARRANPSAPTAPPTK